MSIVSQHRGLDTPADHAPMNVAFVSPSLAHRGGAEAVVAWTAVGLADRGHDVRIFTPDYDSALWTDVRSLEALVEELPRDRRQGALVARLRGDEIVYAHNTDGLRRCAGVSQPIAWYCQEPPRRLYIDITDAALVRHLARSPSGESTPARAYVGERLQQLRGSPGRRVRTAWRRRRLRARIREADACFVNSRFSAGVFEACFGRRPEVLRLGVPPPSPPRPPSERRGIVVPASDNALKNLHGILIALSQVARRGRAGFPCVDVWGPGTDAPALRSLVRDLGLGDRTRLHGWIDSDEAHRRMASAALCVFVPFSEPFGLVAVEALQAATPLVAPNHGGPAETLALCGGGGLQVDPLDSDSIARGVEAVLAEPRPWLERARKAAECARSMFSLGDCLDRTEKVLLRVAADGYGASRPAVARPPVG